MTDPAGEYVPREPTPFPTLNRVRARWELTRDVQDVANYFHLSLNRARLMVIQAQWPGSPEGKGRE